jgi:cysteine desulfurase
MAPTREIYLDNAATTKPHPAVVEAVRLSLTADYGNPSSLHGKGVGAEHLVTAARTAVAQTLGVAPEDVVFTSGGTEANALAIFGVARLARGRHLISTAVEHSSVRVPLQRLAAEGFELTELPVDGDGRVTAAQVERALRPETVLVSVMAVNNELGTLQPIEEIGRIARRHRAAGGRALFHVDAVQGWGKIVLRPAAWGVDLMSVSGHKVHGPKGVGALFVRRGVQLAPMLGGGEQERSLRPGTENVPGIAGMGAAARLLAADLDETVGRVRALSQSLRTQIEAIPDTQVNTPLDGAVPHILNATFRGVRGETLLHRLEQDGVFVSTGSACHSRNPTPSHVLLAIGLPADAAQSTIRFILSRFTTAAEIEAAAGALGRAVRELRSLVR